MSIYFQTDTDTYSPGQTVNGNIIIQFNQSNYGKISDGHIVLHIFGQQHVKWLVANELRRPQTKQEKKTMPDPIKLIDKNQIFYYYSNTIQISDFDAKQDDLRERPKYVRTPQKKYYEMKYFEQQKTIVDEKKFICQCNKLKVGKNVLPFSFKILQKWPGCFEYNKQKMKGYVRYFINVAAEPKTKNFRLEYKKPLSIWENRKFCSKTIQSQAEISQCCITKRGRSRAEVHFEKNGFYDNENALLEIMVDNSRCSAAISSINVNIIKVVKLSVRQSEISTSDQQFQTILRGVPAFTKLMDRSIKENFNIKLKNKTQSLCSGDLLQSQYLFRIKMNHNIYCEECSQVVLIKFPIVKKYIFQFFFHNFHRSQEKNNHKHIKIRTSQMNNLQLGNYIQNNYLKSMETSSYFKSQQNKTIYYEIKQRKFQ